MAQSGGMSLSLGMSLQQKLSPQMIQSLKLLQVSTLQLEQMVKLELEENPVLEEMLEEVTDEDSPAVETEVVGDEPIGVPEPEPVQQQAEIQREEKQVEALAEKGDKVNDQGEVDWDDYYKEGFDLGSRSTESERVDQIYEKTVVARESLEEKLTAQLHERNLTPPMMEMGEVLIACINGEGFLDLDIPALIEICKQEGVAATENQIKEIIHILQSMDPPGVGAANLRETLILQLRRQGKYESLEMRILAETYDLFRNFKIMDIARILNVSQQEVGAAVKAIGQLDPHPGAIVSKPQAEVIIPDLIVIEDEDEFIVMLNDRTVPRLRVSSHYQAVLQKTVEKNKTEKKGKVIDQGDKATKKFLREKFNSAEWFIRSIEQRKATMIRVMTSIVNHQREFFIKGPPNLNPLILQTVADDVNMHISTVSRVTNGKYVQTPHGVYELKFFFGAGVEQQDGTEISAERTKSMIKTLVENEEKGKPYSDQKIVELLKEKNMQVARRTVSKYRDEMNILPARLRKRF